MVLAALSTFMLIQYKSITALGIGFLSIIVMWRSLGPLEKKLDTLERERIKYLRGGEAEALVAWLIQNSLVDEWHLFNNIELVAGSDHDHVLVGPSGVWCFSTKSFLGLFALADDGRVFYNNRPTVLINDTLNRAMELHGRLVALLGLDAPFVHAVLAVPFAYVDFQNPKFNVWVLNQAYLIKTLESRPKELSKDQIQRCVKALTDLANNAKQTYRRPEPSAL